MMVYVANPLYDTVFKYLMEDERIARTMISALLQKQVVDVKMRRHEYPNIMRERISMFRVDFAATIREDDGKEHLILIELQKTWLETETLRFRQYLALQYNNKENMRKDTDGKYALPTVAVYLLGHRVGDINEAVVYARHKIYDYNGNEVPLAQPDPFVESLQHDSIIVQIPLLKGKVNNRLEKVLSVFDQSQTHTDDPKVLRVDENSFADDEDMAYIVHRLQSAASDPDIRNSMNAEDEFFKAIEDRDTEIMLKDKLIRKKDDTIKQKDDTIKQKDDAIKQKDDTIKQKDDAIKQKDDTIKQKDDTIKQKDDAIKQKDDTIKQKDDAIRAAVQALRKSGMPASAIAATMNISESDVEEFSKAGF